MPTGWPKTERQLAADGWTKSSTGRCHAKSCARSIVWYKTPADKPMPMTLVSATGVRLYEPHWISCPVSDQRQQSLFA